MIKHLPLLLFIGLAFWSCEDEKSGEDNLPISFTNYFNFTNFDVGLSIEEISGEGYIILAGSDTSIYGHLTKLHLIKTDINGETVWIKENFYENDSTYGENPNFLKPTLDNGFIISGRPSIKLNSIGEIDFTYPSPIYPTNDGGNILFNFELYFDFNSFIFVPVFTLSKLSNGGELYWEKYLNDELIQLDTNFNLSAIEAYNIIEDIDNNFYLSARLTVSYYPYDYYTTLIKINNEGNVIWAKIYYDEESLFEVSHQTSDGGFIAMGDGLLKLNSEGLVEWRKNEISGIVKQTTDNGYIIASHNGSVILLIKVNELGTLMWEKSIECENNLEKQFLDVKQTIDGGFIIASSKAVSDLNHAVIIIKTDSEGNYLELND